MSASRADLVVVGAGSGGIGAALAAARASLRVLVVEAADTLGGTATRGGVHNWEPGVGGTSFPFEIYLALKRIPDAVRITEDLRYVDTLRRWGAGGLSGDEARRFRSEHWHRVVFEPAAYQSVVDRLLRETGRCELLTSSAVVNADARDGRVRSLTLANGTEIAAPAYVDATGDVVLAAACGCAVSTGQEPRDAYDEPGAPDEAAPHLNGVTLVYRVSPDGGEDIARPPADLPASCWWRDSFPVPAVGRYPNGDYNVNMLPTMEGREAADLGREAAYAECRRRVIAHWRDLRARDEADRAEHIKRLDFSRYRLSWIAPALGVREGPRVIAEYMLNERDLLAGVGGQAHDDIVAVADHAMDTHGPTTGRGGCVELDEPYGVPYRCLMPRGMRNLLVACRGAGFTSRAASSCRLSRTMMQLGHAAGLAAAIASDRALELPDVPADVLRAKLRDAGAQVDWPLSDDLSRALREE